ncbi:MAG: cytochrome c biogenesis protein DipZ [Candidatus Roizmanbacteria bacterium]|nr:cytochrome c biogenesis protein DipZ [Candidatus Roizmanbacteria bacterium]
MTLLFFAFLSGLVTILAPCIWPILPVVLSSSATGGKRTPLGITLGIIVSFGVLTISLSYLVSILSFDPDVLRYGAVIIIFIMGLSLLMPPLSALLESTVSKISGKFLSQKSTPAHGFGKGFITGLSLGVVWTPCAGPILATIAALASTQTFSAQLFLVTFFYVIGLGIPLFLFALAGRSILKITVKLNRFTGRVQQVFGAIMIITAFLILTGFDRVLQAKLLDIFPSYSTALTKLENNSSVQKGLNELKQDDTSSQRFSFGTQQKLKDYGEAPEFTGITNWLNADGKPLTMSQLKGKVVLVDFWTYTCINCIRTLPQVKEWYDKYHDKGLVIVGVHTPEFEFEKKTENVEKALEQFKIQYPVAQDNNYTTWNAYNNLYWPAKYLIDAKGHIRYTHFGEGEYDTTEQAIRTLLEEKGTTTLPQPKKSAPDDTPQNALTPETYLGTARLERFTSHESAIDGSRTYTNTEAIPLHSFAYRGQWKLSPEYAQPQKTALLTLHFRAQKVFLVMTPLTSNQKIRVLLDGKTITAVDSGQDVHDGYILLDTSRLYELVKLNDVQEHRLQLEFITSDVEVFAFTFG